MEVEVNDIAVVIVGMLVHRDADAINILGEFITRRKVTFHGDAAERIRKVYHSHLRVVKRSCTHDKDKIVNYPLLSRRNY